VDGDCEKSEGADNPTSQLPHAAPWQQRDCRDQCQDLQASARYDRGNERKRASEALQGCRPSDDKKVGPRNQQPEQVGAPDAEQGAHHFGGKKICGRHVVRPNGERDERAARVSAARSGNRRRAQNTRWLIVRGPLNRRKKCRQGVPLGIGVKPPARKMPGRPLLPSQGDGRDRCKARLDAQLSQPRGLQCRQDRLAEVLGHVANERLDAAD
jgi:hypothetical protein